MPAKKSMPAKNTISTTLSPSTKATFPSLSDIRETCAFVTNHAQHVHLNHQNLKNFARSITTPPDHWLITNPHNLLSLPLPLLATILLYFEVIDYSFWPNPTNSLPKKWTIQTPSGPLDGSVALLYLLIKNFEHNPALDFSTFSDADFYHFFHPANSITADNPTSEIPLLTERSQTLRETSRILHEKLNNNFYAAIQNFTTDEQLFHFLITTFPSLRDQRTYTPQNLKTSATSDPVKTVHFYKLAQLLTSDLLFIRHHLENIPVDTSNLSGCADYKIPQTLRALDLISYDEILAKLIDSKQLLPENSPYEVEIRAATVSAITFLHDELPQFSPIQINDYLFLAFRNLPQKQPYHLTRNVNY